MGPSFPYGSSYEMTKHRAVLLKTIVDICEDKSLNEKSRKLQLAGLYRIAQIVNYYAGEFISSDIVLDIAERKLAYLRTATTKKEVEEILKPPKPYVYGGEVRVDTKYHVPAEELLIWSLTSYLGPLCEVGFKRYMKLFREYFGEDVYRSLGFND